MLPVINVQGRRFETELSDLSFPGTHPLRPKKNCLLELFFDIATADLYFDGRDFITSLITPNAQDIVDTQRPLIDDKLSASIMHCLRFHPESSRYYTVSIVREDTIKRNYSRVGES